MIDHDQGSSAFFGSHAEIVALRAALSGDADGADVSATREALRVVDLFAGDPVVDELKASLSQTLFSIDISVAGPGGHHEHTITAGLNAVGVRLSPVTEGRWELSGFPLVTLPGGLTRLVRFLPGRPAIDPAHDIDVSTDDLLGLAAPEAHSRRSSWERVSAVLDGVTSHDPGIPSKDDEQAAEASGSWQIVQARSSWTAPDGSPSGELSVHIRHGDAYYLVIDGDEGSALRPVPSLRAWEAMIQVLPDHRDIARPS